MPEDTYRSMVETAFLLRSRTNARRLLAAVDEVERGDVVERDLPGLDEETADPSTNDADDVRAWARENGLEVLARGEIPESVSRVLRSAMVDEAGLRAPT